MTVDPKILPLEMWQVIWSYLSPPDLTRLKRVNSFWNQGISSTIKNEDWQNACLTEISDDDALFYMFHEVNGQNKGTSAWFKMYKSWKLWQRNYNQGSLFYTIDATRGKKNHDKFSCAKVYRSILALGTMNGFIYFYHLSNFTQPFFIADHLESVKKIEFWESQAGLRAISQCQNDNIKFWNLKEGKIEKFYLNHASFVVASSEFLYNGNYGDDRIGIWRSSSSKYQQRYWTSKENNLMMKNDEKTEVTIDDTNYSPYAWNQHFHTEQFSRDQVLSIISIEGNKSSFYEVHTVSRSPVYGLREVQVLPEGVNDTTVKKICVFSDVTFLISRDNLCVNVKGRSWVVYRNIFAKFRGFIKSIALHANLLALGLDSGEVHIFKLKNKFTLENLDSVSNEKKVHLLDHRPIIAVNFAKYRRKRFIIAMSDSKVFILNLE